MTKNILALCLSAFMFAAASSAFADTAIPESPCTKPKTDNVNTNDMKNYESCMAAFIKSQQAGIANHEAALKKAEAAMEDMSNKSN